MNSTNKNISSKHEPSAIRQLVLQAEIFLRDVWRYRWASIITVWAIAVIGWVVVFTLPDKYEASTKILVDTDSILRPLLKGLAVETDLQSKLDMMTRTLLSRPNLEKLARATDMDLNVKTPEDKEKLFASLSKEIEIKSFGAKGHRASRESLYLITYQHRNPEKSKEIVQALLTIFIESTLGGARQDSDVAQKFLDRQIKEYEGKLVEAEKRLMEFKRNNVGMFPGQGKDSFSFLQEMQTAYENAKFQLTQAERKQTELKRQLDELISAASQPGTSSVQTTADGRIDALNKELDVLMLKYTDEHPSVAEIKQSIAVLEEQKKKELKLIATGKSTSSVLESSPVYQEIKKSLGQASTDVETMKVQVTEYSRRIKKLQDKIEVIPKIEAELASLNRDYTINREQYNTLLARRESAKMSQEAENAGDQVKFQIIEPPHVPSHPTFPNRLLFNTAVLIVAFGGGLGLVFLFGQFNPVVHDQKTLRQVTGYPVFGVVSLVRSDEMITKRKKDISIYATSMGILFVVYIGVLVHQVFL